MQLITTYDQFMTGTYGYIVKIGIGYLDEITLIKLYDSVTETTSDSTSAPVDLVTLYDYLEDSDCPDIGFSIAGEEITVFIKTGDSYWSYDDYTKILILYKRNPIPITSESSMLDIPYEYFELFLNYVVKEAAELQGKIVPQSVLQNIKNLEAEI